MARGETRHTAINAFNTRLAIHGKMEESIFLIGGSLLLDGEVSGDVICIGSKVEISGTALIGHDLIVIGGGLDKAEQSRVHGEIYNIRTSKDLKKIASSLLPILPESGGMTFFKVIKLFFWLVLSLLTLAIFPVQVGQAAAMLPQAPLRHLGRGLLALLLFVLLLFAFLLLSFILIGIPLLIMLMAAYFLVLIFGRAAVFYFIGEHAGRWLRLKANPALFIFLGVTTYGLLKFIPYLGGVLLVILDLLAAGIGVGFFLRRRKSLA